MSTNWQNWCRLCAKHEGNDIDIFFKLESVTELSQLVQKYFMISVWFDILIYINVSIYKCFAIFLNAPFSCFPLIFHFVHDSYTPTMSRPHRYAANATHLWANWNGLPFAASKSIKCLPN